MDSTRYRVTSVKRYALGNGQELVHLPLTGTTLVLPAYVVSLLSGCRDFRTIDEHTRALVAQLGVGATLPETVRSILANAAPSGFFVPEHRLRDLPPDTAGHARIAAVGIVTAARQDSLTRCVCGAMEHYRRHAREGTITIVDDARDATGRRERRTTLADLASGSPVPIAYAGAEEKRAFIGELAKAGIDPAIAAFALLDETPCGFSAGANRNALLLHHAGDMLFQVDDDVAWQVASPDERRDELCFSQGHNPNRFEYFPDRRQALDSVAFIDSDVLTTHEAMLGRRIGDCAASCGTLAVGNRTHLSDNLLRLAVERRGRVAVTQNGLIGDCGFQSAWAFLLFRGALRDHLHASAERYRTATSSRAIAQTVLSPTISEGTFCMSYALGLDNRRLLPPFFPVQRNGDGIFGTLLRACGDDALFGHVPIQLVHDPPEERAYPTNGLWRASRVETPAIVLQVIRGFDFGPVSDMRQRMRMLGRHLSEVASVTPAAFLSLVRERAWTQLRNQMSMFQGLLKDYGRSPAYWAADCDRHITDMLAAAVDPTFGTPVDLLPGRTPATALALAQHLVQRFGELLIVWPDMVDAARSLRANGIQFARRLVR